MVLRVSRAFTAHSHAKRLTELLGDAVEPSSVYDVLARCGYRCDTKREEIVASEGVLCDPCRSGMLLIAIVLEADVRLGPVEVNQIVAFFRRGSRRARRVDAVVQVRKREAIASEATFPWASPTLRR